MKESNRITSIEIEPRYRQMYRWGKDVLGLINRNHYGFIMLAYIMLYIIRLWLLRKSLEELSRSQAWARQSCPWAPS